MGERSAVEPKSGKTVRQSVPGLRRPTPPSTAGRKPAARPPNQSPPATEFLDGSSARQAGRTQRKTGRGAGQSPAIQSRCEAPGSYTLPAQPPPTPSCVLGDFEITTLIEFFQILDRWDREVHSSNSNPIEVNS